MNISTVNDLYRQSGETAVGDGTITSTSSKVAQFDRPGRPWQTFISENEHGAVIDTYADQKWAMRGPARMCFVNFAFRGPLRFDGVSEVIFVNPLFEAPIDAPARVQKMYAGKHANCGPYLLDAHDIDIYTPTFRNAGTVANFSKSRNVTVAGFRAYDLGPSRHGPGYPQTHIAARCPWHTDVLTGVGGKMRAMHWLDGEVGLPNGVTSQFGRKYTNARFMVETLTGDNTDLLISNVWAHHFETPPIQLAETHGHKITGRIEHVRSWANLKNYRVPSARPRGVTVDDVKIIKERPRGPAPWEAWVARDPLALARELIAARP